jgi:hypothetical protein
MGIEVITTEDLEDFRLKLIKDIKGLIGTSMQKKWLKTQDVMALLDISEVTLQTLRNNGTIPFRKLGGICYYNADELDGVLMNL